MTDIVARLQNAIHEESATHSPRTTAAIEAMRDAITEIEVFRRRLEAAHEHVEAADREVSYITGLQNEIKRLRHECTTMALQSVYAEKRLRAEIERLQDQLKTLRELREYDRATIARFRARVELADK